MTQSWTLIFDQKPLSSGHSFQADPIMCMRILIIASQNRLPHIFSEKLRFFLFIDIETFISGNTYL